MWQKTVSYLELFFLNYNNAMAIKLWWNSVIMICCTFKKMICFLFFSWGCKQDNTNPVEDTCMCPGPKIGEESADDVICDKATNKFCYVEGISGGCHDIAKSKNN